MKEAAAELRISSVELKKICRDLGVPFPHPKFWARKRGGEKVVELQLPKKSEVTPSTITIKPAQGSSSERPVDFPNDIDRGFKSTRTPSERHPVIVAWLAKRQARMGLSPDGSSLPRWGAAELRGHHFLEEIFRRLEAKGLAIRSGTRIFSFVCVYESEEIHCRLRERKKRVRDAVGFGLREHWTELKPTGLFTFTIDSFLGIQSPIRREWRETSRNRLDEVMPDIASAILQAGPVLVALRRQADEQEKAQLERERLRKNEEDRRRSDQNRWQAFLSLAARFEQASRLRSFLMVLENDVGDVTSTVGDRTITEWFTWAKNHLEALNPLNAGANELFETMLVAGEERYVPDLAEQAVSELVQRFRASMISLERLGASSKVRIPFSPPLSEA